MICISKYLEEDEENGSSTSSNNTGLEILRDVPTQTSKRPQMPPSNQCIGRKDEIEPALSPASAPRKERLASASGLKSSGSQCTLQSDAMATIAKTMQLLKGVYKLIRMKGIPKDFNAA